MEGSGEGVGMERGSHSIGLGVKDQRVSAMEARLEGGNGEGFWGPGLGTMFAGLIWELGRVKIK